MTLFAAHIAYNVHQVHEAPRARRQPGEGVSAAFPKLLPFMACGGQRRNAVRGMNLVLAAGPQAVGLSKRGVRGSKVADAGFSPGPSAGCFCTNRHGPVAR